MNWSEDQKKVINERDSSVLVSAAAGSGKTAVMVERIIEIISDEENGADLDELLIMTFTRAAAQGMRLKISEALKNKISMEPDNRRLKLQRAMLPRARISTIHSFCEHFIRQNYQRLDIDPNFRLADEGESAMLKADALNQVLEERLTSEAACGREDASLMELMEAVSTRANDEKIEALCGIVYDHLMGDPWPEDRIEEQIEECRQEAEGHPEKSRWYRELFRYIHDSAGRHMEMLEAALRICETLNGPLKYREALSECIHMAEDMRGISSYDSMWRYINGISFSRLPAKSKKDGYDEDKTGFVKKIRDRFKKYIEDLKKGFFIMDPETLLISIKGSAAINRELLMLVREYMKKYSWIKHKKNILDFDDLEHLSLKLLYKKEDGKRVPSELANEISNSLKEIMIDEYQDSSRVQEAMIYALSGERFGRNNVFMVGDVKQSIYRFRNAEPDLFIEKYDHYSSDEGAGQRKIELNMNFRSREEVLSSVNLVFDRIMSVSLGGIDYGEGARLKCGAGYEAGEGYKTEMLIFDDSAGEEEPEDDGNMPAELSDDLTAEELEYMLIADRIKEFVDEEGGPGSIKVRDGITGEMRPASYRDITILTRKKKPAVKIEEVLKENGIPARRDSSEGYFEAWEVEQVLNLLSLIDNPMQDIPLAAVMRGPMGDFSDDELAVIRASYAGKRKAEDEDYRTEAGDFYRALKHAAVSGGEKLREKTAAFLSMLEFYRGMSEIVPVHVLINEIYLKTGFYSYVLAMPEGRLKAGNLDMLLEKAESYGNTSYAGLFNFIRYIESIRKYSSDTGEASAFSENDDTVKITTIHKSKGLEYPIVILARSGASLSGKNSDKYIVIDETGIGSDYVDTETGIKYPGLKKALIKIKQKEADIAEEERLLYVAMTRAMEKLVITAAGKNIKDHMDELKNTSELMYEEGLVREKLPSELVLSQKTYFDWIILAAVSEPGVFSMSLKTRQDMSKAEALKAAEGLSRFSELINGSLFETEETEDFSGLFKKSYEYAEETGLSPKVSVSEIGKAEIDYDDMAFEMSDEERTFKRTDKIKASASLKGTAYHRAMQLIELKGSPEEQLSRLFDDDRFSEEEKKAVDKQAILNFLESGIAKRMAAAKERGQLYREQHFMAGIPASELIKGQSSDELQILQGIIDAYFEEDGDIILVDYKTDRLREESGFRERYAMQLKLYARALNQLTKKTVRQSIIYSTFLKKEIVV